jgi:hypothetical protein
LVGSRFVFRSTDILPPSWWLSALHPWTNGVKVKALSRLARRLLYPRSPRVSCSVKSLSHASWIEKILASLTRISQRQAEIDEAFYSLSAFGGFMAPLDVAALFSLGGLVPFKRVWVPEFCHI